MLSAIFFNSVLTMHGIGYTLLDCEDLLKLSGDHFQST